MYRIENDLLGDLQVPVNAYYGVQTQRAIENFNISGVRLYQFPEFIKGLAYVKWAAAETNFDLGLLEEPIKNAIVQASKEVIEGKFDREFPVDMIQGGAGTSTNMNINEVLANRALEIMGYEKGQYQFCSPNDHVNLSQSTNDAYPTAIKIGAIRSNMNLISHLKQLITSFRKKGEEFKHVLKMGRTQLQDAVPMTLGQEFEAFAATLEEEIDRLTQNSNLFLEINMGATAIGTGLNAPIGYAQLCAEKLAIITGLAIVSAPNLIEATPDTGSYVIYSSALKRMAIKMSKICNDLRLLSSGPRCGLNEINLPPMQPGSSIMPGKVNPVIPEVMNQVCFRVIGNDLTVTMAAEAGQLQLNVMEPVLIYAILESMQLMSQAMDTLREKCINGITANEEHCREMVLHSIGIVTALNPYIGYKNSTKIAKEALETGKSVYNLVLEHNILSKEQLDDILNPENMLAPKAFHK
ncbi:MULTISPECIES: aspartate ammonia-lyase [Flavobacterium]|uniref:Aspartate ammonia-lyase n=2 Tax=Flavobacterium TaxID=237 RepID=A0AA94F3F4_9FLAO|nr:MULTISPECIES: aspartate ammonia-lyase [Flavobacterium]OXA82741.1 aspartate ammonia-lyase [Flavobacterium columnare] [Flavobacterium columnare NBRC 100251 = ATCC 23463]AMA49552.1 class II fumarate hydratase [Flavobacterium covae]AND63251.1 aspartate ammonia-lyase [Flavobacterium covae]MCH4828837.1 aspartate ammonia-lyase [Flavobacterium columnare]MCH4832091.1 aspartate ammonia-lyase [Flavobacterium columnare]